MAVVLPINGGPDSGLTFSVDMNQLETISSDVDLLLRDSEPRTRSLYRKCPSHTFQKTEELLSSISPGGTHEHSDGRRCEDPSHKFWMPGRLMPGRSMPGRLTKVPAEVVKAEESHRAVCDVHLHEEKKRFVQGAKALFCFFLPLEYNTATATKYWGAVHGLVQVGEHYRLQPASLTKEFSRTKENSWISMIITMTLITMSGLKFGVIACNSSSK